MKKILLLLLFLCSPVFAVTRYIYPVEKLPEYKTTEFSIFSGATGTATGQMLYWNNTSYLWTVTATPDDNDCLPFWDKSKSIVSWMTVDDPNWLGFSVESDPCFVLLGVPYTGATTDVNLGSRNFITTGTLGAGAITGTSLVKSGGTSSQFLKANGTVDSSTYLTTVTAHKLLSATHDDTTADTVVLGDLVYGTGSPVKWTRFAANAIATKKFLNMTSSIPSWDALGSGDIPALAYLPIGGGTLTGNLLFTDNSYDIGATGATRPRDLFLSRNATIGGLTSGRIVLASTGGLLTDDADLTWDGTTINIEGHIYGTGNTGVGSDAPDVIDIIGGTGAVGNYKGSDILMGTGTGGGSAITANAGAGGDFTFYTGAGGQAHIGTGTAGKGGDIILLAGAGGSGNLGGAAGAIYLTTQTNPNTLVYGNVFLCKDGGKVRIGSTSAPTNALSITGSANLSADLTISGGLIITPSTYINTSCNITQSGAKTADSKSGSFVNTATSSTGSKNKYGLYASSTGTWNGTSANNYGLYIADSTGGTTNYQIYQTGTTGTNILNANTRIGGLTAPTVALDVTGAGKITGIFQTGDGGTTNYVNFTAAGDQSFVGTAGFYPRLLSQTGEPAAGTGATQLDTSEMCFWIDTDDSTLWLCFNQAGTVKTIKLE